MGFEYLCYGLCIGSTTTRGHDGHMMCVHKRRAQEDNESTPTNCSKLTQTKKRVYANPASSIESSFAQLHQYRIPKHIALTTPFYAFQ